MPYAGHFLSARHCIKRFTVLTSPNQTEANSLTSLWGWIKQGEAKLLAQSPSEENSITSVPNNQSCQESGSFRHPAVLPSAAITLTSGKAICIVGSSGRCMRCPPLTAWRVQGYPGINYRQKLWINLKCIVLSERRKIRNCNMIPVKWSTTKEILK